MQIEAKLKEMGIELPPAVTPVANYVPVVRSDNLVFSPDTGRSEKTAASSPVKSART